MGRHELKEEIHRKNSRLFMPLVCISKIKQRRESEGGTTGKNRMKTLLMLLLLYTILRHKKPRDLVPPPLLLAGYMLSCIEKRAN